MIDVTADPTIQLRAIAQLILEACAERDAQQPVELIGKTPAEVFGNRDALPEAFAPPPPPPVQVNSLTPPPPPPPATQHQLVTGEPNPSGAARTLPENTAVLAATRIAAAEAAGVEVDSDGTPYDPNVHSSSRAKVRDGTWKKRRGGPLTLAAPPPPPPAEAPRLPSSASVAGNDTVGAMLAATEPAIPAPPPPPAVVASGPTFRSVMKKITDAVMVNKITHDRVAALCQSIGVPDLTTLNAMPGKIPDVDALVDAELFGK